MGDGKFFGGKSQNMAFSFQTPYIDGKLFLFQRSENIFFISFKKAENLFYDRFPLFWKCKDLLSDFDWRKNLWKILLFLVLKVCLCHKKVLFPLFSNWDLKKKVFFRKCKPISKNDLLMKFLFFEQRHIVFWKSFGSWIWNRKK